MERGAQGEELTRRDRETGQPMKSRYGGFRDGDCHVPNRHWRQGADELHPVEGWGDELVAAHALVAIHDRHPANGDAPTIIR